jgi:hypothetical protein
MKKSDYYNKPLQLLPNYFKKIGAGILIITFIVMLSFKFAHVNFAVYTKEIIKTCTKDLILLSLSFIAFSKDKIEDELTMLIRIKAIVSAFVFCITYFIVGDIISLITREPMDTATSFSFILQALLIYLFTYSTAKFFR